MTDLRTAAQQALEALKHSLTFVVIEAKRAVRNDCADETIREAETAEHQHRAAITALKAALVEDAMQKFTDVSQEIEAALGCDHCNQPLYAAIKCRVCGRVTEPVQEPVANDDKVICPACCHQFRAIPPNVQQMMLDAGFEPPFTTPPQRKPLTEEEALDIARTFGAQPWPPGSCVAFARAIEAKHEITS